MMRRSAFIALLLPWMFACVGRPVAGDGTAEGTDTSGTSDAGGSVGDPSSGGASTPTSTSGTSGTSGACEGYVATLNVPIVTPSVMLMLDQSPAMLDPWDHDGDPQTPAQPRWASVHKALLEVLPGTTNIQFGLAPYPTPDAEDVDGAAACAVTPALFVPTSDAPPLEVLAGLAPAEPPPGSFVGGAPLRTALTAAVALLGAEPAEPRLIVVLANSAANCDPNADGPALLETHDAGAAAAAAAANATGVVVYVFGVGAASEASAGVVDHRPDDVIVSDTLAELAAAGGGSYVNVAGEAALITALAATFTGEPDLSCRVLVDPEPGPDQAVTGVRLDGQELPRVDDCAAEDGWQDVGGEVELCGAACTQFNATHALEIVVSCV